MTVCSPAFPDCNQIQFTGAPGGILVSSRRPACMYQAAPDASENVRRGVYPLFVFATGADRSVLPVILFLPARLLFSLQQ